MELGIKGKKALVLGASQGMGEAIARTLAAEGCDLIVGSRNEEALNKLASDIKKDFNVDVISHVIDMTDFAGVDAVCEKTRTEWQPDILLNNTGGPPGSKATGVSDEIWRDAIQSLLIGVIRISEAALEAMKSRGWGRILTIASSGVIQPIPALPISNTVRSGIVGFSKSLSNEVAGDGITANIILPGRIDTDRTKWLDKSNAEKSGKTVAEIQAVSKATIPAGRYGTVEEFADVAVFLLSERASYITGSMIRVDGGAIKSV